MQYRLIGRTGVKVSQLCCGTMSFGHTADERESAAIFARCRDAGINFFDCADVYAKGRSEEILGDLIQGTRDDLVIASKAFNATGPGINDRGSSRRHIVRAIEASLKRLKTDRLDFYLMHRFDDDTPIDETLRALDELVHAGKVLYAGASNWAAWQTAKALGISALHELARFEVIEPMYNLVKRTAEVEILPMALAEQVGVITYSPLAAGMLTGKYASADKPKIGRIVEDKMYASRYSDPVHNEVAGRFAAHARQRGVDPASLAIAWVASHPAVTAPIIGARNVEQLLPSLASVDVVMTPEWRDEIAALSVDPPSATDRSEERARR